MGESSEEDERELIHAELGHRIVKEILARLAVHGQEAQVQSLQPLASTALGWLRQRWESGGQFRPPPAALRTLQRDLVQVNLQLRRALSPQVRPQVAALLWTQGMLATLRAAFAEPQGAATLLFGALELWGLAEGLMAPSPDAGGQEVPRPLSA
jgi:hypothetical protein